MTVLWTAAGRAYERRQESRLRKRIRIPNPALGKKGARRSADRARRTKSCIIGAKRSRIQGKIGWGRAPSDSAVTRHPPASADSPGRGESRRRRRVPASGSRRVDPGASDRRGGLLPNLPVNGAAAASPETVSLRAGRQVPRHARAQAGLPARRQTHPPALPGVCPKENRS